MTHEQIVVGLDIGTTKIACLVGKKNEHGKIEIIGRGVTASHGVLRGVVANLAKTTEAIKIAVEQAKSASGIDFDLVQVGIAGQHIRSTQQPGMVVRPDATEVITEAEINMLINEQTRISMGPGEEIIHVIPQEYTIDNERGIKDPIGMAGSKLQADFHVIIGNVGAIRNIQRCVKDAGLRIGQLILEPLASSESVLHEEEKEAGIVLVDIGGGTTDIAIFKDNVIRHTAVIPLGGNIITEDIKTGCLIMTASAEALKVSFGSAIAMENRETDLVSIPGLKGRAAKEIPLRKLAQIIEARMTEIIENVFFEIRSSGFHKSLIGGIVVTGGGASLKHVQQLFQYLTAMDCRIGVPNEHITLPPKSEQIGPNYSTGVGLVIMGFLNRQHREFEEIHKGAAPETVVEDSKSPEEKSKAETGNFLDRLLRLFEEDKK